MVTRRERSVSTTESSDASEIYRSRRRRRRRRNRSISTSSSDSDQSSRRRKRKNGPDPVEIVGDDVPSEAELESEVTQGGWRCHVKRMKEKVNTAGDSLWIREHHASEDKLDESETRNIYDGAQETASKASNHVDSILYLVRKRAARSSSAPQIYLQVRSPILVKLLRKIILYESNQRLDTKRINITKPYKLLWHHHQALRAFIEDEPSDSIARKHVQALINFMDTEEADTANEIKAFDAAPTGTGTLSWKNAWYPFRPGTQVVSREHTGPDVRSWVVESVTPPPMRIDKKGNVTYDTMYLELRYVRYNSHVFEYLYSSMPVPAMNGRLILMKQLPVIPISYLDKRREIESTLLRRGQAYAQLRGQHMREDVGIDQLEGADESNRVMVDWATYLRKETEARSRGPGPTGGMFNAPQPGVTIPGPAPPPPPPPPTHIVEPYPPAPGQWGAPPPPPPPRMAPPLPPPVPPPDAWISDVTDSEYSSESENEGVQDSSNSHRRDPQVIDIKTGGLIRPDKAERRRRMSPFSHYFKADVEKFAENGEELFFMLCDFWVWGFSFREKRWKAYHVDSLKKVDYKKKSFDSRVVLDENYKRILKAMVANHVSKGDTTFKDLVAGKGQGLVVLLHGPPGVGKTLTAECIADMYERPLYSVTSGDIGTEPDTIELRLRDIFDYAATWKAVLLLDEADVFLAERNLENLYRNALVSVFLRNLEYFNGIFFLTTNRIGTIDEAFQSRLHVTLGLDPLSESDRREVWYNFIKDLKQLSKDQRRLLAREARDNWCQKDFNGRQIRNCVKTALVLARQDGVPVGTSHFQTVINIGMNFNSYMKRLKKMDRERLAETMGTRLDLSVKSPKEPPRNHEVPERSKRKAEQQLSKDDDDNNDDSDLGSVG